MEFSKRQIELIGRLETLCQRSAAEILPVRIEEVWGFGSFFRLKERPRDLDLAIKFVDDNKDLWKIYEEKISEALHMAWNKRADFPQPADALLAVLQDTSNGMELWKVYSKWAAYLTWSMIDQQYFPGMAYGWDTITKRVLTEGLPRVNIAELRTVGGEFGLVTEAVMLVWSRSKQDVRSNIASALSGEELRKNLVTELEGFDRQLSEVQFELKVRTDMYRFLITIPSEKYPPENDYRERGEWLVSRADEIFPGADHDLLKYILTGMSMNRKPAEQKNADAGKQYLQNDIKTLQEAAEQKRAALKQAHMEIEVVKALLNGVLIWKAGRYETKTYLSRYRIEEWITQFALINSHKNIVKEEQIRDILRRHGLPENKILTYKSSTNNYTLPENEEEAIRISHNNAKRDQERILTKIAKDELKKLDVNLEAYVEVGEDLKPLSVHLSLGLDPDKRNKEAEEQLEWCRRRGFDVEELPWATTAELQVPLKPSDTRIEIASRIQEAVSSHK